MEPTKGTIVKWALWGLAAFVVLWIVIGILSFVGAWGGSVKKIVSPPNVEAQFHTVIEDWQGMISNAENACEAEKGGSTETENSPTLIGGKPQAAYAQNYRRVRIDYNRRQHNFFEAKIVGPPGYPRTAPSYQHVTSWCDVSDKLKAIHD